MAGPITWRNVQGGGGGNVLGLANSGGNLIQQGLANLQKLAADQQALNVQNQKAVRASNTQDYLDQVAAISTAGDLNNPETRQQLDQARLSYGNLIDRQATRGAVDQRAADLQKQEIQTNQFNDMTLEREQRPLVEQLYQYARNGDHAGVDKMLNEVNFLQEGKLASDLDSVFDKQTARERAVRQEARADRSESRQIAQFNESMAAASENRQLRREQFNDLREDRQLKRTSQVLDSALSGIQGQLAQAENANPGGKISVDAPADTSKIMKQLEDTSNPLIGFNSNSKRQTQESIQKLLTDGVLIPGKDGAPDRRIKITPSQMQQFVDVHKGDFNFFQGGTADSVNTYFREMYERNPELGTRAIQAMDAQTNLMRAARTLNEKRTSLLSNRAGINLDSLSGTLGKPGTSNDWDLKARQGLKLMPERDEDK